MAITKNDISIAIKILADSQDAVQDINRATTAVNQYIKAAEKANSMNRATGGLTPAIPQAEINKVKEFGKALGEIQPGANNAAKGLWSLRNMARTALGTLEAMTIFLISQFIGQAIKKSIDSVKQLELAMYNLVVAEKALSKAGIDITPQDFKEIEQAVVDTGIAISKIDIKRLIANTASGTVDLKLSLNQLKNLSVAVAAIAYANNKSIEEVQNTIQTSLTTSGRGLKPLDIPVDALIIKEKAVEAQLVKNKEAYDALTGAEKQRIETAALLLIIDDKANQLLAEQSVLAGGLTDRTRDLSASWEDFTTVMGQIFAPTMIIVLGGFLDWLEQVETALGKSQATISDWAASVAAAFAFTQTLLSGQNWATAILKGMEAFKEAKAYTDNLNRQTDTPTGPGGGGGDNGELDTDLQDALDKMNKEILEAQLKLEQDMIEADIDLMRKLEDIDTEYLNKRAELWIDYQEKLGDINRDYNERIADIEQKENERRDKAKADALDKEKKFQNSLLELRENFLMSLEDALHARDARQVLKLISQYNLDKLQAERKHALDVESDRRDEQLAQKKVKREIEQAKRDRQRKIEEAKWDYEQKLAQLKREEEAERRAARLADKRKREDLIRSMQDRLAQVAAGLVSEYNLTARGLDAIVRLYSRYYSNVAQIYAAMRRMMGGTGGSAPIQTTPNHGGTMGSGLGPQFAAEGGTMIANRPTQVTFGEAGLEMASFTPIGRRGKDVNKLFSSMSGGGGSANGSVSIELLLSPDLEARVISNSLNKTAEIITRVQRSK